MKTLLLLITALAFLQPGKAQSIRPVNLEYKRVTVFFRIDNPLWNDTVRKNTKAKQEEDKEKAYLVSGYYVIEGMPDKKLQKQINDTLRKLTEERVLLKRRKLINGWSAYPRFASPGLTYSTINGCVYGYSGVHFRFFEKRHKYSAADFKRLGAYKTPLCHFYWTILNGHYLSLNRFIWIDLRTGKLILPHKLPKTGFNVAIRKEKKDSLLAFLTMKLRERDRDSIIFKQSGFRLVLQSDSLYFDRFKLEDLLSVGDETTYCVELKGIKESGQKRVRSYYIHVLIGELRPFLEPLECEKQFELFFE